MIVLKRICCIAVSVYESYVFQHTDHFAFDKMVRPDTLFKEFLIDPAVVGEIEAVGALGKDNVIVAERHVFKFFN